MLRQISGMTNIQELVIDDLVTSEFIPGVEHYFGHFLPRVRSLSLRAPTGSRRQVLFFIGLFEHLQDLTLIDDELITWEHQPVDDLALVPPFAPPLRGQLVMEHFKRAGFLKVMFDVFGGARFWYVDLYEVVETQFLLNACAETLETLRLYPCDPYREQL